MKELEKVKTDTEINVTVEQIKSISKLARLSIVPIDGGRYWEIDITNNEIHEAVLSFSDTFQAQEKEGIKYRVFDGVEPMNVKRNAKKSLVTKKNRVYVYALNKDSAIKKLKKAKIVFHTFD
jgi:hypothetical protein